MSPIPAGLYLKSPSNINRSCWTGFDSGNSNLKRRLLVVSYTQGPIKLARISVNTGGNTYVPRIFSINFQDPGRRLKSKIRGYGAWVMQLNKATHDNQ